MTIRILSIVTAAISLAACLSTGEETTEESSGALDSYGSVGQGDEVWRKVRDCGWRSAVVDHNDGPCNSDSCTRSGVKLDYQLVIRDPNIIRYFNQEGVWHSGYGDDEIIIQGWSWPGSTPDQIRFRRILDCYAPYNDCRWVDVYDDWDGVRVEFMHETTYCTNLDPMEGCKGEWKSGTIEEANWWFGKCGR
jgi:hypothetical protein